MKRITLLMVAFLGSIALQAQSIILDQAGDSGSGYFSEHFNLGTPVGIYMADDFVLTEETDIESISIYGFQNGGTLANILTGFNLYIYADNAGVPDGNPSVAGGGLMEVSLAPSDAALTINGTNFTVDVVAANGTALNLAAGTYWVVAAPQLDLDLATAQNTDLWAWFFSTTSNHNDAVFIDPSDALGNGVTSWTTVSLVLGEPTMTALGMTINGTTLGIEDQILADISLYPNPVQNQLNITLPASVELESATMFDLLGQATEMNISENNTLNTANLATGVYVLKLQTSEGTLTQKVIKQ